MFSQLGVSNSLSMSKAHTQTIGSATNPAQQLLIDEEILKHEDSISNLRSLRNTHSPVWKLPREVLAHIFDITANWPRSNSYSELPYSPAKRFNFSFVCHHWRIVSAGTPKLWCFITSNYTQNWTRALLERSRMSRLTYHASPSHQNHGVKLSSGDFFVKEVLRGHLHRIQELNLDFSFREVQDFWDTLPPSPPCLRTLKIKASTYSIDFPGKILHDAPLSTLEVERCQLDWNSSILNRLKHLKIAFVALPTYNDFFTALRRMPDLITLDITEAIYVESVQTSDPVILVHLQRLRVFTAFNGLLSILHCLRVPSKAIIDISCGDPPDTPERREALMSTLITSLNKFHESLLFQEGEKLQYDELQLIRYDEDEIGCRAWRRSRPASLPFERKVGEEEDLRLVLLWILPADVLIGSLTSLQALSQISTLGFSQIDDVGPDALARSFGKLPSLEMLVLDPDCCIAGFAALRLQPVSDAAASTSDVGLLFANLQTLCLEQVSFSNDSESISISDLQDYLILRYESGVPIRQLVIKEGVDIFSSDISSLREIVDVEWDDLERTVDDVGRLPYDVLYGPYGYPGYVYDSD